MSKNLRIKLICSLLTATMLISIFAPKVSNAMGYINFDEPGGAEIVLEETQIKEEAKTNEGEKAATESQEEENELEKQEEPKGTDGPKEMEIEIAPIKKEPGKNNESNEEVELDEQEGLDEAEEAEGFAEIIAEIIIEELEGFAETVAEEPENFAEAIAEEAEETEETETIKEQIIHEVQTPHEALMNDTNYVSLGVISGFLLIQDNQGNRPVADLTVYLYDAYNLDYAIETAMTNADGYYVFSELPSGSYVLGIIADENDDYSLLSEITEQNKFALNPNSYPLTAYTDIVMLYDGMIIESINALLKRMTSSEEIISFDELDEDILFQRVPVGTMEADLNLPDKLITALRFEDGTESLISTSIDVHWFSDIDFDGNVEGTYIFTLEIDRDYTIAADTVLPEIAVTVMQARLQRNVDRIRVTNREELLRVFTNGALTGGNLNWSGERFVEIAFNHIGIAIDPMFNTAPFGTERVIHLYSADGVQRNITSNNGNVHFVINSRLKVVIDDVNLHFIGNNPDRHTSGAVGGGFRVISGGTLELWDGAIRNINGSQSISAITVIDGTFIMRGGILENNRSLLGGAVFVSGLAAKMEMYGGVIRNNTSYGDLESYGGAVRIESGALFNMQDGIIEGNLVDSNGRFPYGGGVSVGYSDSTFNMNGGIIRNNRARRGGGVSIWEAIFNLGTGRTTKGRAPENQTGEVNNPIITNNEAIGGGVSADLLEIGIGGGGGVHVYGTSGSNSINFIMHSGSITNNTAATRGGGVFLNTAVFQMRGGEISNNRTVDTTSALSGGGAIYLHEYYSIIFPSKFIMTGGALQNNVSANGGAITRNSNLLTINISGDSVISGNIATNIGGAIATVGIASADTAITSSSIGTGRENLNTASTVKFENNRANLTTSRGLRVEQVRLNNTIFNNLQWSGKNSVNGTAGDNSSFHLLNNHDIGNLQGDLVSNDFFLLTEKHADIFGNAIEGIDDNDFFIRNNKIYFPIYPDIEGYRAVGYKWDDAPDNSGNDFITGNPEGIQIESNRTIYLVYGQLPLETDVTIGNKIAGKMANMLKAFEFTIYMLDGEKKPMTGKEIAYESAVIKGQEDVPLANGALRLNAEGKAIFTLKHGQTIKLLGVPTDAWIRITTEDDKDYWTTFIDSEIAEDETGKDTGARLVGEPERAFDFLNTKEVIPPMNVNVGEQKIEPMVILSLELFGLIAIGFLGKRLRNTCFGTL